MDDDPLRHYASAAEAFAPMMDRAGGPLGLIGRAVGMGGDELAAGVPKWAWFGIGIMAGAAGMYFVKDRVEAFIDR